MHGLNTMRYLNEQAAAAELARRDVSQSPRPRPYSVVVTRVMEVPGWLTGDPVRSSELARYTTETHENAQVLRAQLESHYASTRSLLAQNQGRQGITVTIEGPRD